MEQDPLAQRFEQHRPRLRGVAHRLLGTSAEADDAVQEAWLRLARTGADGVDELGAWLTTVVSRVALDMLRSRATRRGAPDRLPDPVVTALGPEDEAVQADAVAVALLVVLDALTPTERTAFVLHDLFGMPFEEVARVVDRSPTAARQLASRARRRVRGRAPGADPDPARHRVVVEAFLAAARGGSLDALVAVLHPDVTLRADTGRGLTVVRGARDVAGQALMFGHLAPYARAATVDGGPGVVTVVDGRLASVMSLTVRDGRITAIDVLADPARLAALPLP